LLSLFAMTSQNFTCGAVVRLLIAHPIHAT
jgi:hypothetical protein